MMVVLNCYPFKWPWQSCKKVSLVPQAQIVVPVWFLKIRDNFRPSNLVKICCPRQWNNWVPNIDMPIQPDLVSLLCLKYNLLRKIFLKFFFQKNVLAKESLQKNITNIGILSQLRQYRDMRHVEFREGGDSYKEYPLLLHLSLLGNSNYVRQPQLYEDASKPNYCEAASLLWGSIIVLI